MYVHPITILLSISTQEAAMLSTLTFNCFFYINWIFFSEIDSQIPKSEHKTEKGDKSTI